MAMRTFLNHLIRRIGLFVGVGLLVPGAYLSVMLFHPPKAVQLPADSAPMVRCTEDGTCSDGSSLEEFFCQRGHYFDHGRLVLSEGVCLPGEYVDD